MVSAKEVGTKVDVRRKRKIFDGNGEEAVDWKETQNAHVFKVDVLGLKKEEVKVEIKDGRVLQISGERSQDQEEKSDTCHHVERSSRRFSRRFRLSENSKVEEVKAAIENGVLTINVFKVDVLGLKKEEVKVEIKDGRVLQISGERSQDQEEKSDTCHHVERSSRRFSRRFRLSENSKVEEVKAAIENGVLTVIVPKEEVKRPNVRPIQILINLFRQN
ncbi:17.5 kda class i heat shock protein [Quercus suber]|uniref:17.5 kDa class i heat shock protein n=1 Tax=Quercus suber TaxID=58331 RepID=A0AAW0KIA6_QUESU